MMYILIILIGMLAACQPSNTDKPVKAYVVATSGLFLRTNPTTTAPVIALIPFTSEVTVISRMPETLTLDGKTGQWARVEFEHHTGYAFSGFLASEVASLPELYKDAGVPLENNCLKFSSATFPTSFFGGSFNTRSPQLLIQFQRTGTFFVLPGVEYGTLPGGNWARGSTNIILTVSQNYSFTLPGIHGCNEGPGTSAPPNCVENARADILRTFGKESGLLIGKYELNLRENGTLSLTGSTKDSQPRPGFQAFTPPDWEFSEALGCLHPQ